MGKKKKKTGHGGRGGRKNKGSDDHASFNNHDSELISEELTALQAIYYDDIKVVSEVPPLFTIYLRPYSKDIGSEDLNVSALLSVRCLPGYPYKCPKLKITPEKDLSKDDADKLLSLLNDQAIFNAREGRVMIHNLVVAAQEFLSEIVPLGQSNESGVVAVTCENKRSSRGPFVYGLIDLFGGYGESWDCGLGTAKSGRSTTQTSDIFTVGYKVEEKKSLLNENALALQVPKQGPMKQPITIHAIKEESEDNNNKETYTTDSSDSSESLLEESSGSDSVIDDHDLKSLIDDEQKTEVNDSYLEDISSDSLSSTSVIHGEGSQSVEKDLILAHLLRVACASKGPLADALPEITSELFDLGIFSERVRDLATKPPSVFNEAFDNIFQKHMGSSANSQFWKAAVDLGGPAVSSLPSSRYLNDFEEVSSLGHGGFGYVALCKNKLDGRQYAVKKIRLKDKSLPVNDRILREVATLSRLQHQHVVRYYQAWFETEMGGACGGSAWGSMTAGSSSYSNMGTNSNAMGPDIKSESTYLYIQMEYCPRTMRQVFESYSSLFGKEFAWHLFRQIVEGLAHIHAQGIIHRDLTPNNIFFDARNDIKIGDFGLAKFLKLEQLDQDALFPTDTTGVSVDGTGQVGTYFYTAPEIEQGWPKIDEKVDMYSLGVVFFELWHPFGTAMERHKVLMDLKQNGTLPPSWAAEFPEQEALLRLLMSPSPSDRPSATELLQNVLPPRMEDEWLDDILRAMQSPEDTRVYEKVVKKIFDEERLMMRSQRQHGVRIKLPRDESSFIQYTELDTELRDYVVDTAKEVFRHHCGKRMEITPMRLLDDYHKFDRDAVKLLSQEGDMLELCHELRLPFANWVMANQISSFKRYEISSVYRKAIGHSTPSRYLQGDFDIIGGASALTEAEVIKVVMDILTRFFHPKLCHIRLNNADLLDAIWNWVGIEVELRKSVAQVLSGSLHKRRSSWVSIRKQLEKELKLPDVVINRLRTVDSRFCGVADEVLPRLMGALAPDKNTHKALDELSSLFCYLRDWKIEENVYIDALMPPLEDYHRQMFFQIEQPSKTSESTLLAVGGRYDHLLHQLRDHNYKSNPPGAVGTSLALETIFHQASVETKPLRNEAGIHVLVCSRGGGGLLKERMELAAELWQENIKAEFVLMLDPSLTEQYEYANEHDIKVLVIITETGLTQTGFIKVRHLELKKEKEVERENLVKFLGTTVTQLRNLTIWN